MNIREELRIRHALALVAGGEDAEGSRGSAAAGRSVNPAPPPRAAKPGGRLTGF
jgi:hypothetical protein